MTTTYLNAALTCGLGWLLACSTPDASRNSATDRAAPAAGVADSRASAVGAVVRLAYGTAPTQIGDLRLPTAGLHPAAVVMVLHGGCWQAAVASLDHTAALAEALRGEGYVTWNVEYRRLGEAGGGWPGTFLDVGAALDFVRVLARRYPGRLDTARVVVVGHSAGGHLACWLAARPRLPAAWRNESELQPTSGAPAGNSALQPAGVINLDGPADLRTFEDAGGLFCGAQIGGRLVGGTYQQQPARWRVASPAEALPWGVPCRLLVGTEGMMPRELSQAFIERAHAAGDSATQLTELPATDHFALVDPTSAAWPVVRAAVRASAGPAQ